MQIVIDITDKDYEKLKDGHIPFSILDVMQNGIPLPNNVINGEIIKAIFPNAEITVGRAKGENITMVYLRNNNMIDASFYQDWWNAPYSKEN